MKPRNNTPHWLGIFKNAAAVPQPIAQIDRATVLTGPGASTGVQTGIGIGVPVGVLVGGPVGGIAGATIGIVVGLIAGSAIGRALGNFLDIRSGDRRVSVAEESMFDNMVIERLMKMAFLIDGYLEDKFRNDTALDMDIDIAAMRNILRRFMTIGKISLIETRIFENLVLLRLAEHYGELHEIDVIKFQLKEFMEIFIREFKLRYAALEKIKSRMDHSAEALEISASLIKRRPIDNKTSENKFSLEVMIHYYATKSLDWIRIKYCDHDMEMSETENSMTAVENIEQCEIKLMEGKPPLVPDQNFMEEDRSSPMQPNQI